MEILRSVPGKAVILFAQPLPIIDDLGKILFKGRCPRGHVFGAEFTPKLPENSFPTEEGMDAIAFDMIGTEVDCPGCARMSPIIRP